MSCMLREGKTNPGTIQPGKTLDFSSAEQPALRVRVHACARGYTQTPHMRHMVPHALQERARDPSGRKPCANRAENRDYSLLKQFRELSSLSRRMGQGFNC